MSPEKVEEVRRDGITKVYPGRLAQISLYGRALSEKGEVDHGERGIFGLMDREGRLLPPERVVWERREVDRPDILTWLWAVAMARYSSVGAIGGRRPECSFDFQDTTRRDWFEKAPWPCGYAGGVYIGVVIAAHMAVGAWRSPAGRKRSRPLRGDTEAEA